MRYLESFDITSEQLLGIPEYPENTCEFNYPIYDQIKFISSLLESTLKSIDCDFTEDPFVYIPCVDNDIFGNLIIATEKFKSWFEGWQQCFFKYVIDSIDDTERNLYRFSIETIENLLQHGSYSSESIYNSLQAIELQITEFKSNYFDSKQQRLRILNEIEDLQSQIQVLIASNEDCDFQLDQLTNEVEMLEGILDSNSLLQKPNKNISELKRFLNYFGKRMESHFSLLRQEIVSFKFNIKASLNVKITDKEESDFIIRSFHPVDFIHDNYKEIIDDKTVSSACPEVFIRHVVAMEDELNKLTYDEQCRLRNSDLQMAIVRFKLDYPEYDKAVWFTNLNEARSLGNVEIVSI